MNKILVMILFMFINVFSNKNENAEPLISNYSIRVIELSEKVDSVNKVVDSMTRVLENETKNLNIRIQDASSTIGFLNNSIDSFSTIFSILGIFLAVISFAVPTITYIFGLKPSRKALKDLESSMDEKFDTYLKDTRKRDVEGALKQIENGTTEESERGLMYLSITQYQGYSNSQLHKMYVILKKRIDKTDLVNQLAYILSMRRNDYFDAIVHNNEMMEIATIKSAALQYMVRSGIQEYVNEIKSVLSRSKMQSQNYLTILYAASGISKEIMTVLVSCDEITNVLSDETVGIVKKSYKAIFINTGLAPIEVKSTAFYRIIAEEENDYVI